MATVVIYRKTFEDLSWAIKGSNNQHTGFELAAASGNMVWTDQHGTQFQLTGRFHVEQLYQAQLFRIVAEGTETDNGPTILVIIHLPSGCGWRRRVDYLLSDNRPGGRGVGYIIKFPHAGNDDVQRIQFIFPAAHGAFKAALDDAFEKHSFGDSV